MPFISIKKRKSSKVPLRWTILEYLGAIGLLLLLWIAIFAVFDRIVMPVFTAQGKELAIPSLIDLDYESARQKALEAGFKIHPSLEQRFDPLFPQGVILEQNPPPNTLSKLGRKIKLTLSAGEKLFPVPELIGISEKEAVMRIRSQGFTVYPDNSILIFSDYYPDGVVAEQSMPPASMMRKGAPIRLTVSMGVKPHKFLVPDLHALNFSKAKRHILKAGLSLGAVESVYFPQADSGLVVEQTPQPGEKVQESTPVNLQIAGAAPSAKNSPADEE